VGSLKGRRDHLEDIGGNGRIILNIRNRWEGVDWIHPAQDSDW
jgi:hypothetical protein